MPLPRVRLGDLAVGFTQALDEALRVCGHDPKALMTQFGLTPERLAQPRARLSIPRYMRLGHAAIELSGHAEIGLLMGQQTRLSHMGLAGICSGQAPTLREAVKTLIRFEALYTSNYRGQSEFIEDVRGAWLSFYSISPYNTYNRFVVDSVLSGWQSHLSQVIKQPVLLEKAEIEFAAPNYADCYSTVFNCPIEFGATHNRLRLSMQSLELRNPEHCPSTWQHLLELANQELEQLTRTRSLTERVIQAIGPLLQGHEPDLAHIAKKLQLPPWTLRRKLNEEGTQFRSLLNDTRRDLATAYIRDTELAFGEIAYLLGFASAEAFQRAFKRWLGITPGEFRRQRWNAAEP